MRWTRVAAAVCLGLLSTAAHAGGKSGVEPTAITLPKGASSIQGLGENFEPDLHTGASSFRVPLTVPPGVNGLVPQVAFEYSSGGGNTEVGLGWRIGIPVIQRRTDKGLPRYTDSDLFIIRGLGGSEELVPVGGGRYRQRTEGTFVRVDKGPDGFEARSRSGIIYRFGWGQPEARVETQGRTFAWYLTDIYDPLGNHVAYRYAREGLRPYLQEIVYNDFSPEVRNRIAFEYEARPDAHLDYRATFAVATTQRLVRIVVGHGGKPVRSYELSYLPDSTLSRLHAVRLVGSDGQTAMPPLTLHYNDFDPAAQKQVAMTTPPGRALGPSADLADVNGDSFPDLLVTQSGSFTYYLNDGGDRFDAPQTMAVSPSLDLAFTGTQLADIDGDGLADLVAKMGPGVGEFKYFPGTYGAQFAASISFAENPSFSFEDPEVRLLDLDGDKRVDALITSPSGVYAYFNLGDGHWQGPEARPAIDPAEQVRFSSPQIKLADMNGDGLLDVVHVRSGSVVYWPSMGFGYFDAAVTLTNAPTVDREERLEVRDLDGDGLADLVLLGVDRVDYWLQLGDGSLAASQAITGTPYNDFSNTQFRFADMNGNGTTDILWVNVTGSPDQAWVYLDVIGDRYPGLLRRIENGLGKVIDVEYSSSGAMFAAARRAGTPWQRGLPHAVAVVSRILVSDSLGWQSDTQIGYADGVYHGGEREFRGFTRAERRDIGDESAPTQVTAEHYDVGLVEYALKGKELDVELRGEAGEVYRRTTTSWQTRTLATGTDGVPVVLPFAAAVEVEHIEAGSGPARTVREEFEYDDYGNQTVHRQLGDVDLEGDEVVTKTGYAVNADDWIIDRKNHEVITDLAGTVHAERFLYYDGPEFEGLPLGQVARGELTRVEEWRGEAVGGGYRQKERNQIDQWGNVTAKLDPNGGRRDLEYDALAHTFVTRETVRLDGYSLEATAEYDRGLGIVTSYTEWNGHTTTFAFDALGRLTTVVKPGDTEKLPTTSYEYVVGSPLSATWTRSRIDSGKEPTYEGVSYSDGLGRKRQTRTAAEDSKWVVSDAVGFNPRGGVRQQVHPFFGSTSDYAEAAPGERRDLNGYDALGRKVTTVEPDGSTKTVVHLPLGEEQYDEEDNDPASPHYGTPHLFVSDGLGRTTRVVERNQGSEYVTRYEWNALGKLARIVDAKRAERTFVHDALGRRTDIVDPNIGHWQYVFDDADNLLEEHDSKGRTVRHTYDVVSRPILREHIGADGKATPQTTWHYDSAPKGHSLTNVKGRLAWVEEPAATDYQGYDERGRISRAEAVMGGKTYVTEVEFNALDHETRRTFPDGSVLTTGYNARQLVAHVGGVVTKVEYDAAGKETLRQYGNGVEERLTYDERQRLRNVNAARGATTLQAWTVAVDRVSNVTAITDGLGRATQTFVYDNLYRLTSATGGYGTLGFGYDSTGRIVRRDAPGTPRLALGEYRYEGTGPDQVTAAGGETYGYDENGNLTSGRGRTLEYDAEQQLVRAALASGATVDMSYDSDGDRRLKRVRAPDGSTRESLYIDDHSEVRDGALVRFIWLNGRRVVEVGAGAPLAVQTQAGGWVRPLRLGGPPTLLALLTLLVWKRLRGWRFRLGFPAALVACCSLLASCHGGGGQLEHFPKNGRAYHTDHLGSTQVVTDANGQVVLTEISHPFGTEWIREGDSAAYYRFTDKEFDEELGLFYFGKRYYDPLLGRWISPDRHFLENEEKAVGQVQRSQLYSYVANNPLSLVDPDGADLRTAWRNFNNDIKQRADAKAGQLLDAAHAAARNPVGTWWSGVTERAKNLRDLARNPLEYTTRDLRGFLSATGAEKKEQLKQKAFDVALEVALRGGGKGPARLGRDPGPALCFVAGTLILTETGLMPIEQVALGDYVWSRDAASGAEGLREVLDIFVTPDQPTLALEVVDDQGQTEVIEATREHPFAIAGAGWAQAQRLAPGDELVTRGGRVSVARTTPPSRRDTVYNLEVAGFHTYFVGRGEIQVHNSCAQLPPEHHLMTNKNKLSKARGGPWTPRFDAMAQKAGMSLKDAENRVRIPGHKGPHPEAYHEAVFQRLSNATEGLSGEAYGRAFRSELGAIRTEAATAGSTLNTLLTKQ
jgi:RHS repeat-associated protein